MSKSLSPLKRFFEEYASKATANCPKSQESADRAERWFWSHLTEEEQKSLAVARSRAIDCKEKRKEFNDVCKRVRERLFR